MAKFKAIVRYQRPDGYYGVYIRVAHNKKTRYIKTDKVVNSKGIDKTNAVTDPFVLKYCDRLSVPLLRLPIHIVLAYPYP